MQTTRAYRPPAYSRILLARHAAPLCSLLAALFWGRTAEIDPASGPRVWERWEGVLHSTRNCANPYADVTLRVTYVGPGGRTFRTYGFWDGDNTYRIRAAFPEPGTWRWETDCSDEANTGLHRRSGRVTVSAYHGDNPLYRHGFLKVSEDRRYLTFADGVPFLWMGDTAWAAPHRASDAEWGKYLADREAKHFTVIQVAPAPAWAGETNRQGQRPFADSACTQWNPAYWQSFERKIQQANEAGMVVLLVGLMEPVDRYPQSPQACLFARNLVARLFGNFVVFSPSFDSEVMPLAHEVGRTARDATSVHLITQHPGTPWNQPTPTFSDRYYDEPYLDIAAVQTGHNGGHLDWCAHHAIEWVLHLYRHTPPKPVVNLEAMYDAQGEEAWRAVDARGLGWRTWLSGACGYTYGAGDIPPKVPRGRGAIWKWVTDPAAYDYWEKALQWDSATQMQYLHDFLAKIDWWRLQPAHELIRNQPKDVTRRMVLARTGAGDLAVAYLPDNEAIEIDLSGFPAPLQARWFDPVHGTDHPVQGEVRAWGAQAFTPPAKGDWVLVLQGHPQQHRDSPPPPTVGSQTVNVVVINFDPVLKTRNNLKLHDYMKWSDPWRLTDQMIADARLVSQGYVNYRIVEKIEVDGFTTFRDGFTYTEEAFLHLWEKDRNSANPGMTSFQWLFDKFQLAGMIRAKDVREIWLWGAPYMAWDELHWKTPGDKIPYPTDNPWFYRPYDIPDVGRTIWIMGWNYERGEGEMLESYGHRIESVLALTVGRGIWDHQRTPDNVWNRFTRVDKDFPGEAEVGSVHYAPNSLSDYDWSNPNPVWTFADDWLTYPNLPRRKQRLNAITGGWDGIVNHHLWWMKRLPHHPGVTDGFYNNWWEYIVNYDEAIRKLPPPGATFKRAEHAMYAD